MRPERHRIVVPLALGVLALAGAAGAQAPPAYSDLYDQASNVYEKADWPACETAYLAAAGAATLDRQASRALLRAAACAAQAAGKEGAGRAFQPRGRGAAKGGRGSA